MEITEGNLDLVKQDTNPSKAKTDRQKLAEDFDQFLLLLTTQLQNQDPTDPLDTNEFTNQLVMFSQVEQSIATNTNLEQLVSLQQAKGVDAAVSYIGQVVEADGNGGFLANGNAPFVYTLPEAAEEVKVIITNSAGQAVFSGNGSTNLGKNLVTWDGINSFTGQTMPDGSYNILLKAVGLDGGELEVTTSTTGRVSAVEIDDDGQVLLTVGNLLVPIENVNAVRESSPLANNSSSGDDTESSSAEDTEEPTETDG